MPPTNPNSIALLNFLQGMVIARERLPSEPKVWLVTHFVPCCGEAWIFISRTRRRLTWATDISLDYTLLRFSSRTKVGPSRDIVWVPSIVICRVVTPNRRKPSRATVSLRLNNLNLPRIRIILPPSRTPRVIFEPLILRRHEIQVAGPIIIATIYEWLTIRPFNTYIRESAIRIDPLEIGHHVMDYLRLIRTTPRKIGILCLLAESWNSFITPPTNRVAWGIEVGRRLIRSHIDQTHYWSRALIADFSPGTNQLITVGEIGPHFGLSLLEGSKASALITILAGLDGSCIPT